MEVSETQGGEMGDKLKQTKDFAGKLEEMNIPPAERPQLMQGAGLFFDRGWPSNYVSVGWAARAVAGLIPPVYGGIDSANEYTALVESAKKK
jgi:hypothetical protein